MDVCRWEYYTHAHTHTHTHTPEARDVRAGGAGGSLRAPLVEIEPLALHHHLAPKPRQGGVVGVGVEAEERGVVDGLDVEGDGKEAWGCRRGIGGVGVDADGQPVGHDEDGVVVEVGGVDHLAEQLVELAHARVRREAPVPVGGAEGGRVTSREVPGALHVRRLRMGPSEAWWIPIHIYI